MLTSVQNVCVVTTFYTLEGMKSILLPEFVFFRSRLRLSLKNTNSLFYCLIFILRGCCTSYYNIPSSLPEGAFDTRTFCPDFLFVFCLSAIAFIEPRDYRVVFVIQQTKTPHRGVFAFSLFISLRN